MKSLPQTIMLMLVVGCLARTAVAQKPSIDLRFPKRGVSKADGLFVQITDDGLGQGQFGYRRVQCRVHAPSPVLADKQITVRMSFCSWNTDIDVTTVEASGTLAQGTSSTTLTLRVPQSSDWIFVWWDVLVDGRRDAGLSCSKDRWEQIDSQYNSRWDDNRMLILDLESEGESAQSMSLSPQAVFGIDQYAHPASLSDNWLDLTPYDVVKISVQQLVEKNQSDPDAVAALVAWVHAGGTVWLCDAGGQWQKLGQVHPIFGWPESKSISPVKPERNSALTDQAWHYAILNRRTNPDRNDGLAEDFGTEPQSGNPGNRGVLESPIYSEQWIVERRCGWGAVVAFVTQPEVPPSVDSWPYRQAVGQQLYGRTWQRRHGLMPTFSNYDFTNWLIPGVGLAPVISFQVLITLFVIAIGPLNYWLLRRAGRLHLMVVTVPGAALLVTAALLGYGFLADGFVTRVRVQSITLVDQAKSQGTSWNRLSYYAAFTPSKGLTFSDQTAVYGIEPGSNDSHATQQLHGNRQLVWKDGQQHLASGWLSSRTPTQYLTIEPREVTAKLTVRLDSQPKAKSTYGHSAQLVLVHGDDKQWYVAEGTPVDESFALTKIDHQEAIARYRQLLSGREPQKPAGLDSMDNAPFLTTNNWRYAYRNNQIMREDSSASNSLLARRWESLLGFAGSAALDLPERSFVLVAEQALLPFAVDNSAVEDSSVHIVVGTW